MKNKKQGSGTVYSAHTSATSGGDFGRYTKGSPKSKMQRTGASSSAGILWGLAAGVGAGVVAGLLLAPKDGKTTRTNWLNSATDLYGKAEAALTDSISKMTGKTGTNGSTDSTVSSVKTDENITNLPNL